MKLRFYLRGIGIGIIVAAAICICGSLKNGNMSDEQVKKRAAELGMVQSGDVLTDLGQPITAEPGLVYEEIAGPGQNQAEGIADEQQTVAETEEAKTAEVAETSKDTDKKEEPAKEEVKKEEPAKEEVKKEEPAKEEVKKEQPTSGDSITIVVEKGNGSDAVARKLASAGLITDAVAYDKWLCQNGYDRYIAAGTHQIPKNASQEQIAKILTGRN